jgi:hypothetical protein
MVPRQPDRLEIVGCRSLNPGVNERTRVAAATIGDERLAEQSAIRNSAIICGVALLQLLLRQYCQGGI